ncbi:glycosyltransferase family 61 protein [Haloarcula halophila]|uniref:glycosyltransferase family 61 protein n=1 Tax=Haloarcula TaxID=2237 RepID=UPI0023E41164|nr:glycosyltransferase family 61 protein [Halomicroarcula sp. DFY41]
MYQPVGRQLFNRYSFPVAEDSGAGYQTFYYGSKSSLTIDSLEGIDHPGPLLKYEGKTFDIGRPFCLVIPNGTLLGSSTHKYVSTPVSVHGQIPITSDREAKWQRDYLERLCQDWLGTLSTLYELEIGSTGTSRYSEDIICPLVMKGSGYGHWMTEFLPRAEGILKYQEQTDRSVRVLLNGDAPDWIVESLIMVGIEPSKISRWNGQTILNHDILYPARRHTIREILADVDHAPDVKIQSNEGLNWVKKRALGINTNVRTPRKIYVSRNDVSDKPEFSNERQIRNESELISLLSQFGFERIFPAEYTIPEQAALFAGADEIVIPLGAAMANLMFAENANVVTIFGEKIHPWGQYFESLGKIQYDYVRCTEKNGYINVDIDRLKKIIRSR